MMIKSDVLCGFSDRGGEVREFLTYVSDSDEDSSDYDDDDYDTSNNGGGGRAAAHVQKRGLCRVVNPPPDGYVSDIAYDDDGGDDDASVIFPGPDHEHYSHAHLRHLSRTAIKQYNHNTGNDRFEFVELVGALVYTVVEAAFFIVTFKACQSDDPMVTTSFRAKARAASKSLTDSYDIEKVAPLDSRP